MKRISVGDTFAWVDEDVFAWASAFRWHSVRGHRTEYAARTEHTDKGPVTVALHREIMGLSRGDRVQVDHIDGNGLNNLRENLRLASASQNQRNRGVNSNNTSGFKGVGFHVRSGKWRARILRDGKSRTLGYFSSREEAAKAYAQAASELDGEFLRLR